MAETQRMAVIAAAAAEAKKARDVVVLDMREVSLITDYFIICSGFSSTQVKAIAEHVIERMKEEFKRPLRREGMRDAKWILLDYGEIIVHIFQEDERSFYNLERLWGDAKIVNLASG